jgi:anti-sigma factor RsiW
MTGRIIPLRGDQHREIQTLLPWYVAGGLDEAERARVKAHLDRCAECRAELTDERRLAAELSALPAETGDVEHGWALISQQLEREESRQETGRAAVAPTPARARRPSRDSRSRGRRSDPAGRVRWRDWAIAAQLVLIAGLGVQVWRMGQQPAQYHALGAAPANQAANVVVIFRPETPERDLRQILQSNAARLVDGPTVADAYLLHVPAPNRAAVLTRLRGQTQVLLAEPVDGGAGR